VAINSEHPSVSVTIVTYNSAGYIGPCLESVLRQSRRPLEIVIVDNASTDDTRNVLVRYADRAKVFFNDANTGFCAAQNQAISISKGDWVLTLNPDTILEIEFIDRLTAAAEWDPSAGTICGKLISLRKDQGNPDAVFLDSTGIYFTPAMRHFDRGWHEPDDGRYSHIEYVFGASAAAAMYSRKMIEAISSPDGFFDPDFFAYREDADVAWRAQLLGWRCIYTPHAIGHHVRSVIPGSRKNIPAVLNMHSVKNRFLMRIKNLTPGLFRYYWPAMTVRDLVVVGGCLVVERNSISAFWQFAKCFRRALIKRREIMARRKATDEYLVQWFATGSAGAPPPQHPAPREAVYYYKPTL
jgi:GT2 family glycosyltransferase